MPACATAVTEPWYGKASKFTSYLVDEATNVLFVVAAVASLAKAIHAPCAQPAPGVNIIATRLEEVAIKRIDVVVRSTWLDVDTEVNVFCCTPLPVDVEFICPVNQLAKAMSTVATPMSIFLIIIFNLVVNLSSSSRLFISKTLQCLSMNHHRMCCAKK